MLPRSVVSKPRRSQAIAEALRAQLQQGQLKPGHQLPTEVMLCSQFSVSRTTLREAIQILRAEGLLDVTPGRGSFVRAPSPVPAFEAALYAAQLNAAPAELAVLQSQIQHTLLQQMAILPESQRQTQRLVQHLAQHTLQRSVTGDYNAQLQTRWTLLLTQPVTWPLHQSLLTAILNHTQSHRAQVLANPEQVARHIQIQLRINTALTEHDWTTLQRVLNHTNISTPATAPATASNTLPTTSTAANS